MSAIDHKFTQGVVVCPWCGFGHLKAEFDGDPSGNWDCDQCGKWFGVEIADTIFYFSTEKKCAPNNHKWTLAYPEKDGQGKPDDYVSLKCMECNERSSSYRKNLPNRLAKGSRNDD